MRKKILGKLNNLLMLLVDFRYLEPEFQPRYLDSDVGSLDCNNLQDCCLQVYVLKYTNCVSPVCHAEYTCNKY